MAHVVIGLGTSHSPLVVTEAPMWEQRAISDRSSRDLYDRDGQRCTYEDLARSGRRYERESALENLTRQSHAVQTALDRLAVELAAERPDVVIIVGDDQHELFDVGNMPAVSIFYGNEATTHTFGERSIGDPEFMRVLAEGYAMDRHHKFACDRELACDLIKYLIEHGIDIAVSSRVSAPDTNGFGHAYGFVLKRLMANVHAPVLPVMLNCYYPPNQPTPARCYEIGRALRIAIEQSELDRRVAIVASGGLSHFVTNEELDRRVLDALETGHTSDLSQLPVELLNSGSSEIRNWIVVAAMFEGVKVKWFEYLPVYRTVAGTGIGLAFARIL